MRPAFFLYRRKPISYLQPMTPSPNTKWLWIGGVVGVLTMGALRFIGKWTNIYGLLTGMVVVIAILSYFVIRYVNKKW